MFKRLLAKSIAPKDEKQSEQDYRKAKGAALFRGHVVAVLQAAEVLTEALGEQIQSQLGLQESDRSHLVKLIKLGAYLHDWGKANQHFQEMVYLKSSILDNKSKAKIKHEWGQHAERQLIRHEFLSAILALKVPELQEWLKQSYSEDELTFAVWAAIGHHLKAGINLNGQQSGDITELPDGAGCGVWVYTNHDDFQAILEMGSVRLNLPKKTPNVPSRNWPREELESALRNLKQQFHQFEANLSCKQRVMVAVVKATVIAADLAGSALPIEGEQLQDWMPKVLGLRLTQEDLTALISQKLKDNPLRPFQEAMATADYRVTLVRAGCGTGKTIGAYAWAKKWAVGKRLFLGYPTTGTATQGYLDYAEGLEVESMLMHSRADLDRELLFSGEGEADEGVSARLAAFQTWRKKLVICTVDSILGLMQNHRRPLYSWPALAQSAFVFDEVHAYDSRLFGALLRFLETFRGAPILLMSASFTPGQLRAIQQVMTQIGEPIAEPIPGPPELEQLKRYRLKQVEGVENPLESELIWSEVLQTIQRSKKVLWVTNSVSDCIQIYHRAKEKFSEAQTNILIYHSRFRYKDRLAKHKQVIDAFNTSESVLAVTTQVCEMSLDLSADLLISAMAPAAALIQRLGRLNRRMTDESQGAGLALIYEWNRSQPYENIELDSGRCLLQKLKDMETVSQEDLAGVAAGLNQEIPEAVTSAWLDQNWRTYQDALREDGYTINVLLAEDQKSIKQAAMQRQQKAASQGEKLSKIQAFLREAQAWALPIRIPDKKTAWWHWQRCGFYLITKPGYITYSEEVGTP